MKAELIDVSECKKNLDIEIPQEVVDQEITQIAQELARRARVPGFRPGKAPVGGEQGGDAMFGADCGNLGVEARLPRASPWRRYWA